MAKKVEKRRNPAPNAIRTPPRNPSARHAVIVQQPTAPVPAREITLHACREFGPDGESIWYYKRFDGPPTDGNARLISVGHITLAGNRPTDWEVISSARIKRSGGVIAHVVHA